MKGLVMIGLIGLACRAKMMVLAQSAVDIAQDSVVELQSGVIINNTFYKIKSASGFLIYNEDSSGAYVVTDYNAVQNTDAERETYCQQLGIEANNVTDTIRVVVDGVSKDLTSSLISNTSQTVCVLTMDSIGSKSALFLESEDNISQGEEIYILSYNGKPVQGQIQSTSVEQGYFQYSSNALVADAGAVIVNKQGSVVGMNMSSGCALSIGEIETVLEVYKLPFNSKEISSQMEVVQQLLKDCEEKANDSSYKRDSRENLQEVLEVAEDILNSEDVGTEELTQVQNQLIEARLQLKRKMDLSRKIVYVLAVWMVSLLIWLLIVLIRNHRMQKKQQKNLEQYTPTRL
jgi:hypothetical protein